MANSAQQLADLVKEIRGQCRNMATSSECLGKTAENFTKYCNNAQTAMGSHDDRTAILQVIIDDLQNAGKARKGAKPKGSCQTQSVRGKPSGNGSKAKQQGKRSGDSGLWGQGKGKARKGW